VSKLSNKLFTVIPIVVVVGSADVAIAQRSAAVFALLARRLSPLPLVLLGVADPLNIP